MNCGGAYFPPMEPSIRLHGAAMLTGRASVGCRHPVKGRTTQNLVIQLCRNSVLSRHVRTRVHDVLRRLTHSVDRSPASNTETNTSRKKPRIANDPKENMAPTPPKRKPSVATSRNIEMDPNAFVTSAAPATALRMTVGSKNARKSEAVDGSGEHVPGKIAGGMNGHNVPGKTKRHQEM
ncbi:hypothetical protein TcCL_Unassigned04888 [Trypanosoma cruzi]|nr:hypothetical protein TcCL_Unassigned04888 [Trypanosoma cruzi]